jgi:hypothetical protein
MFIRKRLRGTEVLSIRRKGSGHLNRSQLRRRKANIHGPASQYQLPLQKMKGGPTHRSGVSRSKSLRKPATQDSRIVISRDDESSSAEGTTTASKTIILYGLPVDISDTPSGDTTRYVRRCRRFESEAEASVTTDGKLRVG